MKRNSGLSILLLGAALALASSEAAAVVAQRTFVASVGNDLNDCSLPTPCRSFTAALLQTNVGGEVVTLDSAGYGPVVITKAVSIVAPPGIYAAVSVMSGDGIVVNAGATHEVILRGLTVNAQGGSNGIVFNSGAALHVEGCTVRGFNGGGMANVRFAPTGASKLFLKDSFLRGGQKALDLANGSTAAVVTVDNTRIENNVIGIAATFSGRVTVRNTLIAENTSYGLDLRTTGAQTLDVDLDNLLVAGNSGNGVNVIGTGINTVISNSTVVRNATGVYVQGGSGNATARLTYNVIARNTTGIQTGANGSILTPLSNTIEGNTTNGSVTGSYTSK